MSHYTYHKMSTDPQRPIPKYDESPKPYKFGDYLTSNLSGKTFKVESYKDLSISTRCFMTEPCWHEVKLPSGEEQCMGGSEINKIIPKGHPMYKHFKKYDAKWDKNRMEMLKLSDARSEKYKKEYDEKKRIEEELSNYNKISMSTQPEFKVNTYTLA